MGNARIQFRRGKAAFWESENPILFPGEPGYETDTKRLKIGNGILPWNALPYQADVPAAFALAEHIEDETPHPVYDNGQSLFLLYENAKV